MKKKIANMKKVRETIEKAREVFRQFPYGWGQYYVKEHFRMKSPTFHAKIINEAMANRYFVVASPRESAKSTLVAFLIPIHAICHKSKRFVLLVSNTYKKAAGSLDTIKREIVENPVIMNDYRIKVIKDAEGDSIFQHPDGFKTRFLCKGAEQIGSVRGEKFGAYRPDLIIVDDLEDDEMVKNPERRQNIKDLYDEALIPAGERGKTQVMVIGTILHDDSLLSKLVSWEHYPEYRKLLYRALNTHGGQKLSLWPEKWSVEDLEWIMRNKPDVFAKEYQNDPTSGAMRRFDKKDFRYWRVEENEYVLFNDDGSVKGRGSLRDCRAAIACDLAWEDKRKADYSVILPAYLTPASDLLVEEYICKKGMKPDEMSDILFDMEARLKEITGTNVPIGFEKGKLEKVAQWFLKRKMRERNHYLITKPLAWHTDKTERIVSKLQPRYAQHVIFHKRGMGDLEHQVLRVPSGAHDDLPDALQGIVQLLEFPKRKGKAKPTMDTFMKLRKFTIDSKKPKKDRYVFGHKVSRRFNMPAEVCPI